MKDIQKKLTVAALYEQLAEEATELAHAALKAARKHRNENPTPISKDEAYKYLIEEYTDVILCADAVGLQIDEEIMGFKRARWYERLSQKTV